MTKISVLKSLIFPAVLVFTLITTSLRAQDNLGNKVLLQIGDEKVTVDEFMAVYQKNNVEGEVLDKKSIEDYLQLFINFKLKVKEAEALGLDTVKSFINELKGYRDQLAKPYFVDEEVNKELLQEAYRRMKEDLRVSHILIRVDKYASPQDTLEAYNKIMEIRKRIVDNGEDFNDVAEEVSEDPSARDMPARGFQPPRKGNRGDIGYFTVFDMVLPFEDGAYALKEGEVSMPVRTQFGYHLIKLESEKPALGKVQVAHFFLKMPDNATAEDSARLEARIDSVYRALQAGADWDETVKELSNDKSSANNGGKLPWFGSNRMVPAFIDGIRSIPDTGMISKPVLTSYGWHIIKLLDTKPIGTFEEEKADLKQSLAKDERSDKSKESIIRKIKKEAGYKKMDNALADFYTAVDSTVYKRKWDISKADGLNKTIFTLGDESYNQQEFAEFLEKHQSINNKESIETFVNQTFNKFVDEKVIKYEDARLEDKYPEFKALVKEYRDGILLFELTDQMVWSKAIKDTTGLKKFYEAHKDDYMWGNRINATMVSSTTPADVEKARDLVESGMDPDQLTSVMVNEKNLDVKVKEKKFAKGENEFVDKINWKKGISPVVYGDNGDAAFFIVHNKVGPEPKTLSEARGLITADYQNYLEKEWIKELRKKYTVKVNEDVLSELKAGH